MNAIRFPARSTLSDHSELWMISPPKSPRPSIAGSLGTLRYPLALMRYRETYSLSSSIRVIHILRDGSKLASRTFVSKRKCGLSPCFSAQCSQYLRTSACGAHKLDQSGFGSYEN